ncbi:MAG TPA: tetratricopeptide repeat protein [Oculatellaceae cyanobacterium]
MTKYLSDIRLGDLLAKTGIVSAKQVADAVKTAGNKNLHFGQILVLSGCLKSSDLSAGLEAQSAIRDRTVDRSAATRALETACKSGITFNEALMSIGAMSVPMPTNRLGELLLEAGLITEEQCQFAVDRSLATGIPVGRILVSHNLLSDDALVNVLEIQLRIRDGLITRVEALDLIAQGSQPRIEVLDPAESTSSMRLGELLVRAGILSRTDVINALEMVLHTHQKTGQVLVKFGFITESLLECALNLQQMVENKFLRSDDAARVLKHVEANGSTISHALVELNLLKQPKIRSHQNPNATIDRLPPTQFANPIGAPFTEESRTPTVQDLDSTSWNAMDTRTQRLVHSLRSAKEPALSQEVGIAYGELVKAYRRLAARHLYYNNYHEAEWLYERILSMKERTVGRAHLSNVVELVRLTEAQTAQRKFTAAAHSIKRAIQLLEKSQPYNGKVLASCLNTLAMIYFEQGFYQDAEPLLTRSLTIKELNYPAGDLEFADTLRDYARLLAKTNRVFESEKLYFQARSILLRNDRAEPENFFERAYVSALKAN